ncbi:MAG TPA: TPM domain-containing protein [Sediminibacterium sp.]|nr:TPM domain-containing protein [Sediminibacterium sp.]
MFGIFKKSSKAYFSPEENNAIVAAIRKAEQRTSGEVRVYVEGRCKLVNPVHRAKEIFVRLKMDQTDARNGVLLYLAMEDRQLAIWGDEGIHQRVGDEFWNREVAAMISEFHQKHFLEGIIHIIGDIGEALVAHFPYDAAGDKNELPDDIVFGK